MSQESHALSRLADVAEEIRDELRRANDARDAFYTETSALLAHLRSDVTRPAEEGE